MDKIKKEEQEYFVVANSFAAPICSDTCMSYIKGVSPENALSQFVESYKHPYGLYAANLYKSADDYHKGKEPLAKYRDPLVDKRSDKDEHETTQRFTF